MCVGGGTERPRVEKGEKSLASQWKGWSFVYKWEGETRIRYCILRKESLGACSCAENRSESNAATLDQSLKYSVDVKVQSTSEDSKPAVVDFDGGQTEGERDSELPVVGSLEGLPLRDIRDILSENAKVQRGIEAESSETIQVSALRTEPVLKDVPNYKDIILARLTSPARFICEKVGVFSFLDKAARKPMVELSNGAVYFGETDHNRLPHGFGLRLDADATLHEGVWHKGALHGSGLTLHPNGDYYCGDFSRGEILGKGKFVRMEGSSYEGDWSDSRQNGYGTETWVDGSVFTGEFKNGKKEGKGVFRWADGSRYEGDFRNNQLDGHGKYMWSDGGLSVLPVPLALYPPPSLSGTTHNPLCCCARNRIYTGQWRNNRMHGTGVFSWPDGKVYEGTYIADQKNGHGVFRWPNGKVFEGNWLDNKMHGAGVVVDAKGNRTRGKWLHGKMLPNSSNE